MITSQVFFQTFGKLFYAPSIGKNVSRLKNIETQYYCYRRGHNRHEGDYIMSNKVCVRVCTSEARHPRLVH